MAAASTAPSYEGGDDDDYLRMEDMQRDHNRKAIRTPLGVSVGMLWKGREVWMHGFTNAPAACVGLINAVEAQRRMTGCPGVPDMLRVLEAPPGAVMGSAVVVCGGSRGTLDAVLQDVWRGRTDVHDFHATRKQVMLHAGKHLCDALAACHAKGVAHKNVNALTLHLFQDPGETTPAWKLTDFSTATVTSKEPAVAGGEIFTTCRNGAVALAAPELLAARAGDDTYWGSGRPTAALDAAALDVWTVGALMLQQWNGELPWGTAAQSDPDFMDFVAATVSGGDNDAYAPWHGAMPPALAHLVRRCLAVNPAERCSAAYAAAHPAWADVTECPPALLCFMEDEDPSPIHSSAAVRTVDMMPLHSETPRRVGAVRNGEWLVGDAAPPAPGAAAPVQATAPVPSGAAVLCPFPEPTYTADGVLVWPEGSAIG
jgi:hypothetical protein